MKIFKYSTLLLLLQIMNIITVCSVDAQAATSSSFPSTLTTGQPEQLVSPTLGSQFDGALAAINTGNYDQALQFLQTLNQASSDRAVRGKALRLIADCYYFKGSKGDAHAFLTAVEQYKAVLQHYPDPAKENDYAYYRLALSYEGLKFFYEAASALDKLIVTYPDSLLLSDAMFRLATILRQVGKYSRAAERFFAYLNKYPDGKYVKISFFSLGDCNYRMKKGDFAGRWYDEALKRWPDFHDIPRDILATMGNHYFESGKYALSYYAFSLYVNLYPIDEFSKIALYKMGCASEEMGQISLALKLYSLFIEKYPAAEEAEACTLAMANLGVSRPGIKTCNYIMESIAYLEPLKSYEKLLEQNPSGKQTANILFFKGKALYKYARTRDSFIAYVQLLSKFPQGKYTAEGEKNLKIQAASLVDEYYHKDDFLAVSDIYFQSYGKNLLTFDDFDVAFKMAESLRMIGLADESAGVCELLLRNCKDSEKGNRIILALAKIDLDQGRYGEAENKLAGLTKQTIRDSKLVRDLKITLADLYYKKNQFAKAAPLYADIIQSAGEEDDGVERAYRNYGRSLLAQNMTQAALNTYHRALKDYEERPQKYHADTIADIYMGLGDAFCSEEKPGEGIDMYRKALTFVSDKESKRWLLSRIGKAYTLLNDVRGAEKNFSQLKEATEGEFWPKIADYFSNMNKSLAKQGK